MWKLSNFIVLIPLILFLLLMIPRWDSYAASTFTINHTTKQDFDTGIIQDTLERDRYPGEIRLKEDKYALEDDLEEGDSPDDSTDISPDSVSLSEYRKYLYNIGSDPMLANNAAIHSFRDTVTGYLYVSTFAGVSVINTTNNTLVTRYHTGSTAALASNFAIHSFRDSLTGYLYVSTFAGVSVIDTANNALVTRYHTDSIPALINNSVQKSFRDSLTGYLYVSTSGGLSVIDTVNSTLITNYHTGSTAALASNSVTDAFRDTVTGYLYVSTSLGGGVSVIDTANNILIKHYHTGSTPALASDGVYFSFRDTVTGYLYVSTSGGLSVIDTVNNTLITTYNTGSTPALVGNDVIHSFRDSITGYLYVSTNGGGVSVIDTTGNTLIRHYGTTGAAPNLSSNNIFYSFRDPVTRYLYVGTQAGLNTISRMEEGQYVSASIPLTQLWRNISWEEVLGNYGNVSLQYRSSIDEDWSDWSDPCVTSLGCEIDPADVEGKEWIQYRLNLSTTNPARTPVVNGVTLTSGYQGSGEFVSSVIDAGQIVSWNTLTSDATLPIGTGIAFSTRTGNTSTPNETWSNWSPVNSPISSPNGRYLQYKAVLSTTNEDATPILDGVSLVYSTISPTQTPIPTSAPELVINSIGGTGVSGNVLNYLFKSGHNVTFKGTASPFAFIKISVFSNPKVCETTADSEGYFECTFPFLEDGMHEVEITATDLNGMTIVYPRLTLGINVTLASTGISMLVPHLFGLALFIMGIGLYPSHNLKKFFYTVTQSF